MTTNPNTLYWHYALAKSELKVANVLKQGRSEAMTKLNKARAAWQRALTERKPVEHYQYTDYETTIAGIRCGIVVLSLTEGRRNTWGHPDNQLPDDPAEIEYAVVDRKGYEADWLRDKVDRAKLDNHVWALVHGRPVGVGVY